MFSPDEVREKMSKVVSGTKLGKLTDGGKVLRINKTDYLVLSITAGGIILDTMDLYGPQGNTFPWSLVK